MSCLVWVPYQAALAVGDIVDILENMGGDKVTESDIIKSLFEDLMRAPLQPFPPHRGTLKAPSESGVYIIYDPRGNVVHVGRTPRGVHGIWQRLTDHLHNRSSFTTKHLEGDGSKLRNGYEFRCIVIEHPRQRTLLEAYATGCLCPDHLGTCEIAIYRETMPQ
jgi:hypothetical protein